MARRTKTGLDYFPLDVNFLYDRKIRRIIRKQGSDTIAAIIALFSVIYGEKGYYLLWDDDTCFDLSELTYIDTDTLQAIVDEALRVDLFDEEQFRVNGILTSRAIQQQYITCTQKRKSVVIEESYALIDKCSAKYSSGVISVPQTDISGEEIPISAPEIQQRKEKKIESKLKEKQTSPLPPPKMEGEMEGYEEGNELIENIKSDEQFILLKNKSLRLLSDIVRQQQKHENRVTKLDTPYVIPLMAQVMMNLARLGDP